MFDSVTYIINEVHYQLWILNFVKTNQTTMKELVVFSNSEF